jgi:hypothetical protein
VFDYGSSYNYITQLFVCFTDMNLYQNLTVKMSPDNSNWTTIYGPVNSTGGPRSSSFGGSLNIGVAINAL